MTVHYSDVYSHQQSPYETTAAYVQPFARDVAVSGYVQPTRDVVQSAAEHTGYLPSARYVQSSDYVPSTSGRLQSTSARDYVPSTSGRLQSTSAHTGYVESGAGRTQSSRSVPSPDRSEFISFHKSFHCRSFQPVHCVSIGKMKWPLIHYM